MAVTHISRTGKTYYLHTGPKRGGGTQHFFSSKRSGNLAANVPDGFEIYENVGGQVFLRRQQPKLISDDERDCVARRLEKPRGGYRYKVEVRGKVLTIHESSIDFGGLEDLGLRLAPKVNEALSERFAHYQPMLRFVLVDVERRLFEPERYCFKGRVDDWINIGRAEAIHRLASKYLKHLGQESFFEMY